MTPEWSDFKVLLALARAGSVAGAARELQVDHSTISRRLAALEEAVGARLLIRGGREFAFTAEGRTLLEAGQAMEATLTQALRTVRSAKAEVDGNVRVSVSPGFVPVLIRLLLPALRETHPELRVELDGGFQRVDLARGDADIAVRMARPEEPDLVACHVFDCGWSVYAAESYLAARGYPATFDELAGHELVLYAEDMHHVVPLKWMERYRGPAGKLSRMDNLEIACQAIAAGGGIGVLPCFIADAVPGLRRVFAERVAVNPGWVVYHEAARDTPRIRVVADALGAFFRAHAAMFMGDATSGGTMPTYLPQPGDAPQPDAA
ncbi:LysR family transcriptional regulator [Variovorax humicola]|uniref:LysR family transcriptional regulator n=1 Tax=Variovorax humicola TaxID=1769758 RepID=A0ABU8VUE8_9BURK